MIKVFRTITFLRSMMLLSLISLTNNTAAHHSFAAEFSYELFGVREGEVIEVLFVNPHAHIFFSVETGEGREEIWDAQSSTPQNLLRRGWSPDTIKIGDRIAVEGNLGLEDSRRLWIVTLTLEDGKVIHASGGDN